MTADPTVPRRGRRRPALRAALTIAAGAGLLATLAPAAVARPVGSSSASGCHGAVHLTAADRADRTDSAEGRADWAAADAALAGLTGPGYGTSALGAVRENGRLVWRNATGVADLGTGRPADPDGRFRIGSTTKTFVATTLLQLVGERRLDLDDRLECLLPGVVPNSTAITVRQLLNHTSGIANYTQDPAFEFTDQDWLTDRRFQPYSLQALVDIADRYPPAFPPGRDWGYSNTNFVLIGMIIEKLTGHSWQEEVTRRIIRPLHLTGTSMPGNSPFIPGPHAHGYLKTDAGPADVTLLDPSMAGSAGAGISTTADLTTFVGALLGGRLLPPAELAEMQRTSPNGGGRSYGLGLQRVDTPCGTFWGHAGGIPGYSTLMLGSADGKRQFAASLTVYDVGDGTAANAAWNRLTATALCGTQAPALDPSAVPGPVPDLARPGS
ncbi:serine hydrolase domain-containing protein [Kitasatospora cathayae]|uniref:Serine hydrolase n=1 Tax=Kitasatospora cathayae TaxID=3004092 RepID=A0ABY7QD15_9ACTN|nr:serine hydrolase domain-containing protein [Kitasatospora sp. HUAS 3-15]WBP90645.1 serine hydrolase [Kitasatospora sp. HUAS 3-15]